mgnify:CR=1 FL=1
MSKRIEIKAIVFAVAMGVCFQAIGENQKDETPELQEHRAKLKNVFEQLQPVRIYGRVEDTEGNPVAGAEVKLSWQQATVLVGKPDAGRFDTVKTGKDGRWEFVMTKPHRAFVNEVKKQGYQYTTRYNSESSVRNLVSRPTSQDDPIVTVLRRKGETTFLVVNPSGNRINNPLIRVLSPQSQTKTLDLLAEENDKNKSGEYADFQVAANYDETEGNWIVTYSATNGTDGIIVGNDLLYEAPEDGYQQEVVLNGPPWPRYLYLRSRTPAIYSRLDLEHSIWKESEKQQGFRISYKSWVNPYGSRNLEYDTDLKEEWRLRKQLEKDAKSLLKQGKRPEKPDLKALIKAEKEKKK